LRESRRSESLGVSTANGAAFDPFVAIDNAPDQAADDRHPPTNAAAAATARIMYRYRDCDRNEGDEE